MASGSDDAALQVAVSSSWAKSAWKANISPAVACDAVLRPPQHLPCCSANVGALWPRPYLVDRRVAGASCALLARASHD